MHTSNEVYNKIKEVYPDIGEYGKDIVINYDSVQHLWVVDLKKGRRHLKTYLEENDADTCIDKGKCFGLGIQIAELRRNIMIM